MIIYSKQFGCRVKFSIDHVILSIIDKIQQVIGNLDFSCGIFLDLILTHLSLDPCIFYKREQYA